MRFVQTLSVPAGKTEALPAEQAVRLIGGTLKHIEIAFPPGPGSHVSVVIMDRNLQIAPINPEASFAWDDYTMSFSMNYPLDDAPYELLLRGWSPEAVFAHTITFRFDVEPAEEDDRSAILDYLKQLVGMPQR